MTERDSSKVIIWGLSSSDPAAHLISHHQTSSSSPATPFFIPPKKHTCESQKVFPPSCGSNVKEKGKVLLSSSWKVVQGGQKDPPNDAITSLFSSATLCFFLPAPLTSPGSSSLFPSSHYRVKRKPLDDGACPVTNHCFPKPFSQGGN